MSAVESETQHIRDGSRIESCKYRLTHDGAAMSPVMSVLSTVYCKREASPDP